MPERVYLDHNATSPLRPACRDAMLEAMSRPLNPSSVHAEGQAARALVDRARRDVADAISAPRESVVFTSGGSEGDNAAIHGLVRGGPKVARILVTATEHAAVHAAAGCCGVPIEIAPVDAGGVLDLAWLERRAGELHAAGESFLLCAMLANNETGVIGPVAEAARIVRTRGGYVLCDAVQALFKIDLDFSSLGADVLVVSAHKAGGPIGVGAMVVTPGLAFDPLLKGGAQESYRRAGTHNVPGIAGFGELARTASPSDYDGLAARRDAMEAALPEGTRVWGRGARRLPNTSCFTAPGFASERQLMGLDLAGFAISAGSACSSGKTKPSPVLTAMGADEGAARCAARVSTGWNTPEGAEAAFLAAWTNQFSRIARRAA